MINNELDKIQNDFGNLLYLSGKQVCIVNYAETQPTIYKLRKEILQWILYLLMELQLTGNERTDIFFHFTKTFDFYVQSKREKEIKATNKIQEIALSLLNLQLKLRTSIRFERDIVFPSGEEIYVDFYKTEMKILKTLRYQIIFPTIDEFTHLLVEIFSSRYKFPPLSVQVNALVGYMNKINHLIISDERMNFNILALDKAVISLFSSIMMIRVKLLISEQQFDFILKDFYDFLSEEIKVVHLHFDEFKSICSNLVLACTLADLMAT